MTHSHTPHAWLWPDRTIGKRESRILREEHNEAINQRAELLEALEAIRAGFLNGSIKWTKPRQSDSDPYHPANTLMTAAIAKATEVKP